MSALLAVRKFGRFWNKRIPILLFVLHAEDLAHAPDPIALESRDYGVAGHHLLEALDDVRPGRLPFVAVELPAGMRWIADGRDLLAFPSLPEARAVMFDAVDAPVEAQRDADEIRGIDHPTLSMDHFRFLNWVGGR
jgi:hypothetical protein